MELPTLNPTARFIIIIIGLVVLSYLYKVVTERIEGKGKVNFQIYNLRDSILTKNELAFYQALVKAVNGEQVILSKVRISDIFSVSRKSGYQAALNRINPRHIDFLLCDKGTFQPLVAIELDDSSHNRADRRKRDQFVNALFEAKNLPLVRFPAKGRYDAREIEERIILR